MSLTRKHKETLRLEGTCEAWSGHCVQALLDAGFTVYGNATPYRVRGLYKGLTIDGELQVDLAETGRDKVEITIRVTADGASVFAMILDPCQRIRNAFFHEFRRPPR
jgi:hypothetical protein